MKMDLFKQNLAPIPQAAWEELNERAALALQSVLATRKALHIDGPLGLQKQVVTTGRLAMNKKATDQPVESGIYEVKSLIETRNTFELSRWELDNVLRGTKDIDLERLDQAAKASALFEENVLLYGHSEGQIKGLMNEALIKSKLPADSSGMLKAIAEGVMNLQKNLAQSPFDLVVSDKLELAMNQIHGSKLLRELVEKVIGGRIIRSEVIKGALLLPSDHADLEMIIGQDYTLGYDTHNSENIRFFLMNSFTLNVFDPSILVAFDF